MYEVLLIIFLLISIILVVMIILQQSKSSDIGMSFGTGTSTNLLSPSCSSNFITRTISILALTFFVLSLFLNNISRHQRKNSSVWEKLNTPIKTEYSVTSKK
ncbi:preprotein translocase subunit SecG [Candidatus Profftia sp. (ex Adelges kitamiensis)]|uniref:preprotein translocase subunit SecG n=1 Tax=Candidatus Profftia sp. (ex Adelges kitamiensis) TaxID=2864218 RepID=UPI001CE31909|nr:preprotein translocase subunit SecG [Candidatus Profftia sp. (ex Adelges kitamiensis)]